MNRSKPLSLKEQKRKCFKCGDSPIQNPNTVLRRFPKPGVRNALRCEQWAKYCFPQGPWSSIPFQTKLHTEHRMLCNKHFKSICNVDSLITKLLKSAVPDEEFDKATDPDKESNTTNIDNVEESYSGTFDFVELCDKATNAPDVEFGKFTSVVTKCEETKEPITNYGKVSQFVGYEVVLDDTILFPAGGGQPHDIGFLNDIEVVQVIRRGEEAVHFTTEPIEVGTEVKQKINWDRRFDHMQQHSGQHLLSAILENEHNLPTTSWWLGAEESYVELDSTNVSDDVLQQVEARCNELIRSEVPVKVKFYKADDPELNEAHTRGLPKDCTDTLRLICIENVDENLCCGTHVSNLSQLQVIKLLGAEPGKKGKTNLKFLVGNRVTDTFQHMLDREKALTVLLKNEPSKHEELIQKLQRNLKIATKSLQNVLSELAEFEVDKIKRTEPKPDYVFIFKKEATPNFNRAVSKGLENEEMFVLLVSEDPDKPNEGHILIQGPQEHCNALGQQITELLKGKGAFKNGKFQGKAGDLDGIHKCKKLIIEYFKNMSLTPR